MLKKKIRCRERALQQEDVFDAFDASDNGPHNSFELADHATFCASSFEGIAKFLPRCTIFEHSFIREHGVWKQTGPLFFVVEGVPKILRSA